MTSAVVTGHRVSQNGGAVTEQQGNRRFSITPAIAALNQDLSDTVFRTLSILGTYGDREGWCYPKQTTLAEIRGVSRKTINEHIKELRERGYLEVYPQYDEETGARKQNMYRIQFDYPPSQSVVTPHVTADRNMASNPQDVTALTRTVNENSERGFSDEKNSETSSSNPSGWRSAYTSAMEELEAHFANLRRCPPVDWNKGDKRYLQKIWRTPCKRIWEACGSDTGLAKEVMSQAFQEMKKERLTIHSPASVEKVAVSLAYDRVITKGKDRMTKEVLQAMLAKGK